MTTPTKVRLQWYALVLVSWVIFLTLIGWAVSTVVHGQTTVSAGHDNGLIEHVVHLPSPFGTPNPFNKNN